MTRFSAFATHLLVSLLVVGLMLGAGVFLWYPPPLFEIDGGWQGLRMVVLIDLVLGPLLTLIVYRPGKPKLKFDMGVIFTIQLAALSFGVWTLYQHRPALLVYADDMLKPFALSVVEEVDPDGSVLRRFGSDFPLKLAIPIPTDPEAGSRYLLKRLASDIPLHLQIKDYVPLADWWPGIVADSLNIERYVTRKTEWQLAFQRSLHELDRSMDELVFLPIKGRNKSGIIVAEAVSGEFIHFLDIPFVPEWGSRKIPLRQRLEETALSAPADQTTESE